MMDTVKRRKMAAEKMYLRQRNYRRIRDRALARLANLHREEYKLLLAEERKKDEANGKTWSAIDTHINNGMGDVTESHVKTRALSADNRETTRNDGGKE